MDNDIIKTFLENEIRKGQAAYEMLMDGYGGDFDEYFKDYKGDYEVIKVDGEEYIHRIGTDEYYDIEGALQDIA